MRSFFRSECAALFVGPTPAYGPHVLGFDSLLNRITKVQSVSYGFDINREEIKQIGHDDLLTRKINVISADPLPGSNIDVNIEPVPVNFEFEYLPTCGLNEYFLNLNVVPSGEKAEHSLISRHYGDKNFFLVLRNDVAKQANKLIKDDQFAEHFVVGIGNAFINRYTSSASIGSLIKSSVGYQASNIKVEEYTQDNYIPAIHLGDGVYRDKYVYKFGNEEAGNEYDYPGLVPNYLNLKIEELSVGGVSVRSENANATSFDLDIQLDRRNLYGMGSMYPYDRKLNLPGRGSLNLNIIKKDLNYGNLNTILQNDKPYKITIDCQSNCPAASEFCGNEEQERQNLITYVIDNAVLKNQNTNLAVNDIAGVNLGFDFTLTRTNGFLISGGCLDKDVAPGANDPFPPPGRRESSDPDIPLTPAPTVSNTPTQTQTPTVTPTISVSTSLTPSVTPTISPSPTVTPTNTVTPTISVTPTNTITPTISVTPTATSSVGPTPTISVTTSPTITPTSSSLPVQVVRFQYSSTYLVEGQTAQISVYRDQDSNGNSYPNLEFEVDYSTHDTTHYGFASSALGSGQNSVAGVDYDYKSGAGTLHFGQGEVEKIITVTGIPIPGSNEPLEGDEYFYVELSNGRSNSLNVQIHKDSTHAVLIVEPPE